MNFFCFKKFLNVATAFVVILAICGCSKNPFTDPYAYAPVAANRVWKPSATQAKKISSVDPVESLMIPTKDEELALGDLFEIALNNSPETQKSWQEARESAVAFSMEMSNYLPSAVFDVNYSAIKEGAVFNGQFFQNNYTSYGPYLLLNYIVWDSGKRKYATEQAFQMLQQANWMHNEEVQTVVQRVASSYYAYLYAKALLQAYEDDLLNAEEMYKAAQGKTLSGIFDQTDFLQAKTNYLKKKVSLTSQTAEVQNSFINLLTVLGIPSNAKFCLGTFPEKEPIDPYQATQDELVEVAKQYRPELAAAKAEILSAEANLKKAKAEILPVLSFNGQAGQLWYDSGQTDNGDYIFEFNLTFPIFSGFYYLNQIKQAKTELKKTTATYHEIELRVLSEVRKYYNDFVMAKQEILDTRSYLEAAQIEFNAMFERYKVGIVDIIDLLSSQAYLSDARALYAQSQQTYYMAIINVAFATGTLTNACPWTTEETK